MSMAEACVPDRNDLVAYARGSRLNAGVVDAEPAVLAFGDD